MQQNQFQPFRTLFICKNDCVTTKNKQNIQKKRPIFHRPLHCCTFRGQFLTAVFLFLDILLKLRAVALRFTDLRQPPFQLFICFFFFKFLPIFKHDIDSINKIYHIVNDLLIANISTGVTYSVSLSKLRHSVMFQPFCFRSIIQAWNY